VRDSMFSISKYYGKSGNTNFRFREPRNQLRGLRSETPAPQTKENWASRPLCHTQASDRQISSWVGDHQRIPAVVCFFFGFCAMLSSAVCLGNNRAVYSFCRLGICYYAWKSETHDYEKRVALHGEVSSFCGCAKLRL
jgi:hypothetical protein